MGILTYNKDSFLMDGEKYTILSGTIHYFRTVPDYWEDRLKKLKACGLNTVETYTCWNLHECKEGEFDFSGILDVERFIDTANNLGLNIILRPGPYICAEWEFGGLPSWLLTYPKMRFRCYDELFLSKVRRYYKELFSRLAPRFSTNGGNIIMVQIENEYGSYGNDKKYLKAIADIYRECNVDILLFTSDGPLYSMINGGTVDGELVTLNFGSKPASSFEILKEFRPNQPLMCCEFWNGWFDHWYEKHHVRTADDTAVTFDELLSCGSSVNFYMFHGGTNFGFTNGANYTEEGLYQPTITSYDYDAPLTEAGDLTQKYFDVKRVIEKHFGKVPELDVSNSKKISYGDIKLTHTAPLFANINKLSAPIRNAAPLTMEELGQNFGFILYSTVIKGPYEESRLIIDDIRDRALIFINGQFKGIFERSRRCDEINISLGAGEEIKLDILVENMGRINYGSKLKDEKGILHGVRLGLQQQFGWTMYPLPLDDISSICYEGFTYNESPAFLKGTFETEETGDTFLKLDGFTKGVAFINGFNLGRYWNTAGPQKTLYIPAPLLKKGSNELVIFELEGYNHNSVTLIDKPDLG